MKLLCLLLIMTLSIITNGQSILGQWETYDDETKEKKAIIEIYKSENFYYGKIIENFSGEADAVCENCKGKNKNQPIIGLVVIENIKEDGDEFSGGTIMDPNNGKTYKCYLELENDDKLKGRGYLGFSVFGRTQYWIRKK